MSALAIAPDTDPSFLSDLQAARREALGVLRTVLAALTPKPGSPPPPSLTLLREARLAAVDVLALKVPAASHPLPEGGGRGVGLSDERKPSTPQPLPSSQSRTEHALPAFSTAPAPTAPAMHSPAPHPRTPSLPHTRAQLPPLLRARTPSPAQSLLNRLGAAP